MFLSLLRFWTGPLPHQELFPDRKVNLLVHWFFHPAKRWLAKIWLLFLQRNFGLRVIAITGSVGKTTTKDMLYSILSLVSPTVATQKNITPTYSIPQAILRCKTSTRFLILEMGVEYPGDMLFYTWMAHPNLAILTSINLTHTQFFGTLERLTLEKTKLLTLCEIAISNADDPNIHLSFPSYKFGYTPDSFTKIVSSAVTPELTTSIQLQVDHQTLTSTLPSLGSHLASPAAAAATAAFLVHVPTQIITRGLEEFIPPPHRLKPVKSVGGALILDDAYNASPLAVTAALNTLLEVSRLTKTIPVFVFGQMNELGRYEQYAHEQVGLELRKLGFRNLLCLGPATKFTMKSAGFGDYFDSQTDLENALAPFLTPKYCILIKGSRTWDLDQLVDKLTNQISPPDVSPSLQKRG
jgi:UDP-N-acetylmuramoyl-tripeptide--D-alanyl-D-alanine ligase